MDVLISVFLRFGLFLDLKVAAGMKRKCAAKCNNMKAYEERLFSRFAVPFAIETTETHKRQRDPGGTGMQAGGMQAVVFAKKN